jgi:hypothetical protein
MMKAPEDGCAGPPVKRLLIVLGLAALVCWWRNRHDHKRHPLGGFTCVRCEKKAADLSGMVRGEEGYVAPDRRQGPREERTH